MWSICQFVLLYVQHQHTPCMFNVMNTSERVCIVMNVQVLIIAGRACERSGPICRSVVQALSVASCSGHFSKAAHRSAPTNFIAALMQMLT